MKKPLIYICQGAYGDPVTGTVIIDVKARCQPGLSAAERRRVARDVFRDLRDNGIVGRLLIARIHGLRDTPARF
jgi:hypothetical protein